MGDGCSKWPGLRSFLVKVNPLKVTGGFRKLLNLFGCDGVPVAVAEVLSNATLQIINTVNLVGHMQEFTAIT